MAQVQSEGPQAVTAGVVSQPTSRFGAVRRDVAHAISTIVHPLLFPLVTIIVVGLAITHNFFETLVLAAISVAVTSVPVAIVVFVQVKRGLWTDMDVSRRQQRYTLYPFVLGCLGLLAYVYYRLGAPNFAVRAVLSLLLANIVDGIVNFAWKISAHATTAAACAALLWQLLPGSAWGPSAAAGAALVGWSRVELSRHTKGQVVAGWIVGASSTVVALNVWH